MSILSEIQRLVGGDDHWFSLLVALVAMALAGVLFNLQWFWLLVIGMLVSGILEFAIKGLPINNKDDKYGLEDAAASQRDSDVHEDNEQNEENTQSDGLDTLRERYARGELTQEQFEQKLDHLFETDTPENAAEWRQNDQEQIKE